MYLAIQQDPYQSTIKEQLTYDFLTRVKLFDEMSFNSFLQDAHTFSHIKKDRDNEEIDFDNISLASFDMGSLLQTMKESDSDES